MKRTNTVVPAKQPGVIVIPAKRESSVAVPAKHEASVAVIPAKRESSVFRRRLWIPASAGMTGLVLTVALSLFVWVALPLPRGLVDEERSDGVRDGVTIVDRNGITLRSTRATDGSRSRWVRYDAIDPDIINAFVAVEDQRFWEHHGVDPKAVARAARSNFGARRVISGASTITMQLARLLVPVKRNLRGKFVESIWALRLERHLSKQQIMEQYLNRLHLGQGAVGIAAAGALYFGVSPSELSVGQAATLAGLAHAPSNDNPHVSVQRAKARRNIALARMEKNGFVFHEDAERARQEPVGVGKGGAPFLAAHFTTRVLTWNAAAATAMAPTATVQTSIDAELQRELEIEVRHTVDMLRDRGVAQAAVVVLNNLNGEVLAWVGSPDFWDSEDGQTDMVVSTRQPGSALKPFLYALALDRGFTAATILPDIPKSFASTTGPYAPRNYDRRFRGPVRMREALASSYNVPAVEIAARLGTPALLHTLQLAGFESLKRDAESYGLGLALGNGDVSLLEMANAYRALANGGEWRPWVWRLGSGSSEGEARRVASPMSSAIVLDILQDAAARIPGFGVLTPFDFPFATAVKTGTSRHFTDNWAVATTRGFTVAVWAGNFTGKPMEGVSGVSGAGPLLHRAVMAVAKRLEPGELTTPAAIGARSVPICRLSGMRATSECEQQPEWFAPGTEPTVADSWQKNGRIALPDEFAEWASSGFQQATERVAVARDGGGTRAPEPGSSIVIAAEATTHFEVADVFRIISPADGDRYAVPHGVEARYATIPLKVAGAGSDSVQWSVDGAPVTGNRWPLRAGTHIVRALARNGQVVAVRIVVEK